LIANLKKYDFQNQLDLKVLLKFNNFQKIALKFRESRKTYKNLQKYVEKIKKSPNYTKAGA